MTFAIIKYYIYAIGHASAVWEKVNDPNPEAVPTFITGREARDLIKKYRMEKVHTYGDGEIWDFPDRRWTKRWRGIFKQRRREHTLAVKMRAIKRLQKQDNET